ncbi:beta-propeller fold lactonase family protein [Mycolicibacterium sp. BiH015]|uniref:YVTN family beta-propeller repeat protein n=1 Tax=Mycolicibacterium sp. BiH015 TaxID=3018808 RepID=UPI0022E6AA0B|nr:beta-propeller fold lactonase family protein [Mycolicibacterium sp. BiH015]MDA2891027.1 beta-propeller fold lactonase family protein [Mycolicibacterium sp. BiH015]
MTAVENAKHIGRIGGLAVALGIGAAICGSAGAAWADDGASESSESSASATSESGTDEGASHSAGEGTAEREAPADADEDEPSGRRTSKRSQTDAPDDEGESRTTKRVTVSEPDDSTESDEEPEDSPAPAAALSMTTAAGAGRRESETTATATYTPSSVTVGRGPAGVALGDGETRAYVANSTGRSVSVVDTASGAVLKTIAVPGSASAVAVHGSRAYVTLRSTGKLAVIDTSTYKVVSSVSVGWLPSAIAVNSTGSRVYVTNTGSGTLSVIDATTNRRIASTWLGWSPAGVTVSPDDSRVYAAVTGSDRIAVVSAATNRVTTNISVGDSPRDVAVTADKRLYAAYGTGTVAVIDTTSNSVVVPSISVGPTPTALVISPRNSQVYVANSDDSVSVIDTRSGGVLQTLMPVTSSNIGDHDIAVSADGELLYISDKTDNTLRVVAVNAAPVLTAGPAVESVNIETGIVSGTFTLTDADGVGPYSHYISAAPSKGSVEIVQVSAVDGVTTWRFTYTPTLAARQQFSNGTDGFTVVVRDSLGAGTAVVVSVPIEKLSLTTGVTPISVGNGSYPVESVVSGSDLYVLNSMSGTVSVINRSTRVVTHTISVGPWVSGIAATPDGKNVYVGQFWTGSEADEGLVSVIDTATKAVTATVEVTGIHSGEFGAYLRLIASPDSRRLYVASQFSGTISVIDTRTNQLLSEVDVGQWQGQMVITPDGTRLLRTAAFGAVEVIDITQTPVLVKKVQLRPGVGNIGSASLAVNADGTRAYVLTTSNYIYSPAPQPLLFGAISVVDIDPSSPTHLTELDVENVGAQGGLVVDSAEGRIILSDGVVLDIETLTPIYRVPHAGPMTLDPDGTLFVTSSAADVVYAIDLVEPASRASALAATTVSTAVPASGTVNVGRDPSGVAITESRVYVANSTGKSVSVIDRATGSAVATVPVAGTAVAVAVSPNGSKAYVTLKSASKVAVIDTATNRVVATISVGLSPTGVVVSPNNSRVYVTNVGSGSISVIDAVTNKVVKTVWAGSSPTGVAISPDGSRVYAALRDSDQVMVFNTATNAIVTRIAVGDSPRDVVVTADGSKVYVANGAGSVSVISTANNAVVGSAITVGPTPTALTVGGSKVFVANSNDTVSVIDTATNSVVQSVAVDAAAESGEHDIAIARDGRTLFVTDLKDAALRVIPLDTAANRAPVVVGTPSWSSPNWTTGEVTGGASFSDPDGDALTYTVTGGPARGTVTLRRVGDLTAFTYQPTDAARQAAYTTSGEDTDSFTITASDGVATVAVAFTVVVAPQSPVNRAPELQGAPSMQVDLNTGRVYGSFSVAEPDGDLVSYSHASPIQGSVSLYGTSGPATTYIYNFTFYPTDAARQQAAQTAGADTVPFGVTISDGRGGVTSFTIDLPVEPRPADMPVWREPSVATYDAFTGRTTGRLNVVDPDGDPLVYRTSYGPWYGTLDIDNATGTYVYVPYLNADEGQSSYEIVTVSVDDGTYVTHHDWWVQTFRNDVGPL